MVKLPFIVVMCFVLVFFVGLSISFAQEIRGTISGTVFIENSSVLGAEINLLSKSVNTLGYRYQVNRRTTIADASGKFTFSFIPYGIYDIKIKKDCVTFRKTDVEIKSAETLKIEVKIASEDCKQKELEENAKWKVCEEISSKNNIELNNADKNEIFRELLKNADEEEKIPDYNILINQPSGIVMFSENADKDWFEQIVNLKITVLSYAEIQALARKKKEDILVLSFNYKIIGNCVKAMIGTSWVIGEKTKQIYLSGGGCSYTFRKESGKWIGKQEICEIS